jgi:hypothetical protein
MLNSRIPRIAAELQAALDEVAGAGAHVIADSDVFYGHLVEHGTSHSAPHPFLVPSLEANRKPILAAATAVLRKIT